MATCKNCFRKYDDRGVRDGLFSSYPNFEFCSSVCAGAKREANEQQRDRESAESQAAEYQQRAFEAQKRAQTSQLDELIRLQKEANRIAEEESEARSLGISRKELLARQERQLEEESNRRKALKIEEDRRWRAALISREEGLARLEGLTREEWRARKSIAARKEIALRDKEERRLFVNRSIGCLSIISVLFVLLCTAIKISLGIVVTIAIVILIAFLACFLQGY
jgi:hypothetical protein